MRWPLATALLSLALFGVPGAAHAQSAAIAETLFREGQDLLKAGKVHDACEKFAASFQLDPALGTLLNLARCHENEGKLATAWTEYNSVARRAAAAPNQKAREDFARGKVTELEPKLNKLTIEMAERPAGLEVRLDDQPIPVVALGSALPLDPGKHRVAVNAPGKKGWAADLDIGAGKLVDRLKVPALEDATATQAKAPVDEPKQPSPTSPVAEEQKPQGAEVRETQATAPSNSEPHLPAPEAPLAGVKMKSQVSMTRVAGIALDVLGALALGAGGILDKLAVDDATAARSLASTARFSDKTKFDSLVRGFHDKGTASKVLYGAGAAVLVAGVVLTALPTSESKVSATAAFLPLPDGGALLVTGGF